MKNYALSYPVVDVVSILVTYGVLLAVLASIMTEVWEPLVSWGGGYLVIVAPVVMGGAAYQQRRTRKHTRPHRFVFYAAIIYPAIIAVLLAAPLVWEHYTKF